MEKDEEEEEERKVWLRRRKNRWDGEREGVTSKKGGTRICIMQL